MTKPNSIRIAAYCQANPIVAYADYREELPEKVVDMLLESKQDDAREELWEHEIRYQDNAYQYDFPEAYKAMLEALNLPDTEANKQHMLDNLLWDFKDYWETCASNTTARVTITLYQGKDDVIEVPHYDNGEDENLRRETVLNELFGMTKQDCDAIEPSYSYEIMKLCGTVNLKDFMQYGKTFANKVVVKPSDSDNVLFHASFNGAGSMGKINIRKEVTLNCTMRLDRSIRYGVDEVYGFNSKFWDNDLNLIFEDASCLK